MQRLWPRQRGDERRAYASTVRCLRRRGHRGRWRLVRFGPPGDCPSRAVGGQRSRHPGWIVQQRRRGQRPGPGRGDEPRGERRAARIPVGERRDEGHRALRLGRRGRPYPAERARSGRVAREGARRRPLGRRGHDEAPVLAARAERRRPGCRRAPDGRRGTARRAVAERRAT